MKYIVIIIILSFFLIIISVNYFWEKHLHELERKYFESVSANNYLLEHNSKLLGKIDQDFDKLNYISNELTFINKSMYDNVIEIKNNLSDLDEGIKTLEDIWRGR